jgi:hypothetical protein
MRGQRADDGQQGAAGARLALAMKQRGAWLSHSCLSCALVRPRLGVASASDVGGGSSFGRGYRSEVEVLLRVASTPRANLSQPRPGRWTDPYRLASNHHPASSPSLFKAMSVAVAPSLSTPGAAAADTAGPSAASASAALLLSFHPHHRPLAIILGATRLASTRANLFLQAGQEVLVIDDRTTLAAVSAVPADLRARADRGELALEHHPEGWRAVLDKRREEIGLVCVVDSG